MPREGLTPKQEKFCQFYAASGNATQSAVKAGYSEATAYSIGEENLRKPDIIARLQELTSKSTARRIATAEERQEFWTKVMYGEEPDATVDNRLRASELLGKSQGQFLDRHEISGSLGIVSEMSDAERIRRAKEIADKELDT